MISRANPYICYGATCSTTNLTWSLGIEPDTPRLDASA
jgi:hypothetical protein